MRALRCVLVCIALAALAAGAHAQTPAPYVCPDVEDDGICDSHPTWPVCRCGVKVNCTDNCIGHDNPDQFDYDCDGRGNGNQHTPDLAPISLERQRNITMACDPCLFNYNPLIQPGNVRPNRDGDAFDDACDCAPDDPQVPRTNRPCPVPVENNDFLWIWMIVLVLALVLGLLIFLVLLYVRRRPAAAGRRLAARGAGLGTELPARLYGSDLFALGATSDSD